MAARRWFRTLHRYAGAVVSLFMLLLALTGGGLIFKDEIWRLQYPELTQDAPAQSPARLAAAFGAIRDAFDERIRMIRTPREGLSAYHVYLEGGEALVAAETHAIIDEWAWYQSLSGILAEIHIHLAAADTGKNVVGALGLLLAAMALSGLYLWWPVRRQFRWQSLRPAGMGRGHLLRLHRDLGVVALPLMLLFGLTGAGVVFGGATQAVLNVLLASPAQSAALPTVAASRAVSAPDAGMIATAQAALPKGSLVSWSPPRAGSAVHYLRFRMPGEVHPNGRSTVHLDGIDGSLLQFSDARQAPRGTRAMHWLYPLHAVQVGGWGYRALAALAALAVAVLACSGLLGFFKAMRRNKGGRAQA